MKANLMVSQDSRPINGYRNIIQAEVYGGEQDREPRPLNAFDDLVDNNELAELLAIDIINFYPLGMVPQLIQYWTTKIEHGGIITISGLDLIEAGRVISFGTFSDLMQINQLIYGKVTNVWNIRKSFLPLNEVAAFITGTGQFDITQVKYDQNGLFYYISGKRK